MMKKQIFKLLLMTTMGFTMMFSGCGGKQLELTTEKVEVELGTSLDLNLSQYVNLDETEVQKAELDLSYVDMYIEGEYLARITYKNQTVELPIVVKDTTAPKVNVKEMAVLAGTPIFANDMITEITEASGAVMISFPEGAGMLTTDSIEVEDVELEGVRFANTYILYEEIGTYEIVMTIADIYGNSTEVPVEITVGTAPIFTGADDMTILAGTDEVDYLEGVTATDYTGKDITDKIRCDGSLVDINAVGDYEITYTVVDEYGFENAESVVVTVTDNKKAVAKNNSNGNSDRNGQSSKGSGTSASNASNTGNAQASGSRSTGSNGNGGTSGNGGTAGSTGDTGSTGAAGTTGTAGTAGTTGNVGGTESTGNASNSSESSVNTEYDMFNPPSYEELVNKYGEAYIPPDRLTEEEKEAAKQNAGYWTLDEDGNEIFVAN